MSDRASDEALAVIFLFVCVCVVMFVLLFVWRICFTDDCTDKEGRAEATQITPISPEVDNSLSKNSA